MRKEYRMLTMQEIADYHRAVNRLKQNTVSLQSSRGWGWGGYRTKLLAELSCFYPGLGYFRFKHAVLGILQLAGLSARTVSFQF